MGDSASNQASNRARTRPRSLTGMGLVLLMVLAGLASLTAATQQSATAAARSLSVSPSNYVGGQSLTWTGNVGARGVRTFVLQSHMDRPGDQWTTVVGFKGRTRADGGFTFNRNAPSMFGIKFRVKAGKYVSGVKTFNAKSQDLVAWVTGQGTGTTGEPGYVAPGIPFAITVDTTPNGIFRSPGSDNGPVFFGRGLTLQRRVDGDTWTTVARSVVGPTGLGQFLGLVEDEGTTAYRVRKENVTTRGSKVGWTQSFPLVVLAGDAAADAYRQMVGDDRAREVGPTHSTGTGLRVPPNAGSTFGWYRKIWDFDWEEGQSLTSPPSRGASTKGWWLDYSDGSGRVTKHNGGIMLDSKRLNGAGPGDFGTVRATLQGHAAAQGRWETRMRIRSAYERGGRDYNIVALLVPANPAQYACGAHNITIAKVSAFSNRIQFGARSPRYQWNGSTTAPSNALVGDFNYAVEVSTKRITWFFNGRAVGTVNRSAYSGIPMTLRLALEGQGQAEMNQASLISDWQRGWPLGTGRSVASKNLLARQAAPAAC